MRWIVLSLASLAGIVQLQDSACAQTQAQARDLANDFRRFDREIFASYRNLVQMGEALPVQERAGVGRVSTFTFALLKSMVHVADVAVIYSQMSDPKDRAFVRNRVVAASSMLLGTSDTVIVQVNEELARFQSPAAIAEAQKLRDQVQSLQDRVRSTIPEK